VKPNRRQESAIIVFFFMTALLGIVLLPMLHSGK